MAIEDKHKWDKKHLTSKIPDHPIALLVDHYRLAVGKEALDIACGMGRNARFLVNKGFHVDALDISTTAIDSLQNKPNITAKEVDFDSYTLDKDSYDLIVCTYFLERRLFPQIISALKKNGLFIFETYLYHPENERQPSNKAFLLQAGELEKNFSEGYEILHLEESWGEDHQGHRSMKGSLVVRKQ